MFPNVFLFTKSERSILFAAKKSKSPIQVKTLLSIFELVTIDVIIGKIAAKKSIRFCEEYGIYVV